MTRSRSITATAGALLLCGGATIALAQPAERPHGGPGPGPGAPAAEHRGPPRDMPPGEGRGPGPGGDARGPWRGLSSAAASGSAEALAPVPSGSGPRGHAYGRGHGRGPVPRAQIDARRERAKAYFEAARQTRAERVKARREAIRKRWGDWITRPPVENELRLHAWRLARLEAIKRIATDEGNVDLAARCDALVARETARHERRMEALKSEPGAASAAPASASPTPAPKPAAS